MPGVAVGDDLPGRHAGEHCLKLAEQPQPVSALIEQRRIVARNRPEYAPPARPPTPSRGPRNSSRTGRPRRRNRPASAVRRNHPSWRAAGVERHGIGRGGRGRFPARFDRPRRIGAPPAKPPSRSRPRDARPSSRPVDAGRRGRDRWAPVPAGTSTTRCRGCRPSRPRSAASCSAEGSRPGAPSTFARQPSARIIREAGARHMAGLMRPLATVAASRTSRTKRSSSPSIPARASGGTSGPDAPGRSSEALDGEAVRQGGALAEHDRGRAVFLLESLIARSTFASDRPRPLRCR